MGVLTVEAVSSTRTRQRERWLEYSTLAVFFVLTAVTVRLHEPWSDEANSWLLARDATLFDLWSRLMHYEGTPGLWQSLLHVLMRAGLPYSGLNIFSGALGCAAAWLFVRKAPLPLAVRMTMPFTFYLCYQYSVVARSYCLLPVLLFSCAFLYPRAAEKLGLVTALLCLMAGVSVHGMIISGAIWVSVYSDLLLSWREMETARRWKLGLLTFTYFSVALLLAWSAWPASDALFAKNRDYSWDHLVESVTETLGNAYTGEWISSLAILLGSIPFLWRGRGLLMFLTASLGLFVFNAYVYANVWHEGMPLLAWLFAMWISGPAPKPKWIFALGMLSIAAVTGVQGYWAFQSTAYDWRNPYSGSREAAHYLRDRGVVQAGVYGFGFAAEAVQPYFSKNIYPNFRDGEASCYYDWSVAYRNFEGLDQLEQTRPEYVLVGYKDDEQKILTGRTVKKSGYRLVQHFEGNLFWHDDILEPDGLDLYQRIHESPPP
jgi:hypothetical protein